MKVKTKLFLDMDGVLSDFVNPTLRRLGSSKTEADITHWDMPHVLGISAQEFWAAQNADERFWLDLPVYEGALEFYHTLTTMADVHICTSPSLHPNCASHKLQWLEVHLGLAARKSAIVGSDKHLLSCMGRILIDDTEKKIAEWEREGGWTFLFPRPWNVKRNRCSLEDGYADALSYVKMMTE
jgi:5'(3')-deoxyribonucleotidase